VVGYDIALVDCPPSLGLLTLNALAAASRLVVVTEASFLALQGTAELLETLELVRTHYNGQLELGGVIVNRVERTVEHRGSVVEIERVFRRRSCLAAAAAEADCSSGRDTPGRRHPVLRDLSVGPLIEVLKDGWRAETAPNTPTT
jgi:cellulose biosynthesis protein BcsQ